jgi:hypothetical protein
VISRGIWPPHIFCWIRPRDDVDVIVVERIDLALAGVVGLWSWWSCAKIFVWCGEDHGVILRIEL